MTRAAAIAAVLGAVWAGPLAAQLTLRLAGVRSSYADRPAVSAAMVAPRFDWSQGTARAAIEGGYSAFEGGGWAAQAGFQADDSRRLGPIAALAVVGSANANWLDGGTSSWRARLGAQLGRRFGPVLLSVGGGAGGLQDVSLRTGGIVDAQALASVGQSSLMVSARAARTATDSLRFTDAVAQLNWRHGRVALDASGGMRRVDGGTSTGIWQVAVTANPTPAIALDLASGQTPPSPEGFASGFYFSGGARFTLLAARTRASSVVERLDAERVRVRLRVPHAARVAIAGEWNGWAQVPMTRDGDDWVVTLTLASGAHEFAISVDGGRLTVPAGVPMTDDEFGGKVGLLMVP